MSNLVTGLFDTQTATESAIAQLKQNGYTPSEISILMKDAQDARDLAATTETHAQAEAKTAVLGGSIGALLGGLLAVGTVAIPGVGLIAAGALAALFVGGGGLTGSLIGWMVGAGIPEDIAPYYERGLHEGGIVVTVAAHPGDEANVSRILHAEAIAHAASGAPSYVSPDYASRHADLIPPSITPRE